MDNRMDIYICSECREEVDPYRNLKNIDTGIGSYEYWGAVGHDSHIQYLTVCCESSTILYLEEKLDGTISETANETSDFMPDFDEH